MAKTDEQAKEPENKKGGLRQLVLATLLLLGLVIGSASAAVVIASVALRPAETEPAVPDESEGKETEGQEVEVDPQEFAFEEAIIVNVRQTNQRRYLSTKPVFVMVNNESL